MAAINGHTTRSAGTILTAAIYNNDHVNHITNATALNTSKLEGAAGPVTDGHGVIFNGTTGAGLRTLNAVPAIVGRLIAAGVGLTGGGDLSADRTLTLDQATAAQVRNATANKALTPANKWAAAELVTLTDAVTIAVDMSAFINAIVTLADNRTLGAPTNTKAGQSGVIIIKQDATGGRTLAYNNVWRFPGGTVPVLSTAADAIDKLFYFVESSATIHAEVVKDSRR